MAAQQLVLYVDFMSQPSRACIIFCRLNHIPAELKLVNIAKGEQRSAGFRQINPLGKVPVLQDGELHLTESAAILCHLATSRHAPDHWYPAEAGARAQVNAALHWFHTTLRAGAMRMAWHRVIGPLNNFPFSAQEGDAGEKLMTSALKDMERYWLAAGRFLAGRPEPSVADLLWACELQQLQLLAGAQQGPTLEQLLQPHPKVAAWLARTAGAMGDDWKQVNSILDKATQRAVRQKEKLRAQGQGQSKL